MIIKILLLTTIFFFCINGKITQHYNINVNKTTTSGISSGGFMAVQFHLAHSSSVVGCGVFAGGPYWCAKDNENTALTACMKSPLLINLATLVSYADN